MDFLPIASCNWKGFSPYTRRESQGGQALRQSGQARKGAAVTNSVWVALAFSYHEGALVHAFNGLDRFCPCSADPFRLGLFYEPALKALHDGGMSL